jgi:putative flippase GtrA
MPAERRRFPRERIGAARTVLARAFRYGVAGVFATVIYAAAVAALVELTPLSPIVAAAIATTLVFVTSYVVNRMWVFDTNRSHASAISRFAAASVVSLVLNTGLMYLSVHRLGWSYLAGLALATTIVPPTNFVINYVWSFQSAPQS